jgi:hypothetical protein
MSEPQVHLIYHLIHLAVCFRLFLNWVIESRFFRDRQALSLFDTNSAVQSNCCHIVVHLE